MKRNSFKVLLVLFIFVLMVGLFSCEDKVKTIGIEITSMPTKVVYEEGEKFLKDGLVVSKVNSDDSKEVITDYTIDKKHELTVTDTFVTVTYKEFTAKVNITVEEKALVKELVDVEIKVLADYPYALSMPLERFVNYREVYSDETTGEWVQVVEADLLNVKIVDNILTATVSLFIQNKEWTEDISLTVVESELLSIKLNTLPSKTVYAHSEGIEDLNLTGGTIELFYDGFSMTVDLTADMLPEVESAEWGLGVVNYTVTYEGKTTVLPITYENQAISVSEFISKTSGTYDVTGIVVGPNTSYAAIELLLKDINTMDIVGIYNTGVAGAYNAPELDTNVLNAGDQVIVRLTRSILTSEGFNQGKAYANAVNKDTFIDNLIIESSDNEIEYDFSLADVTEISTQEGLVDFLESDEKFYGYVKFIGLKGVTTASGSLRIFLGDDVDSSSQVVTGSRPLIAAGNSACYIEDGIEKYFIGFNSDNDYDNPVTTTYDVYALYVGGNKYQLVFSVLGEDFFVETDKTVKGIEVRTKPTKLTYIEGEYFNPEGLVIEKVLKDGSKEVTTSYEIDKEEPLTLEDTFITISYENFSLTILITVEEVPVVEELVSIEIETLPTKTVYSHREGLADLDLTGGKLKLIYEDSSEVIDLETYMLQETESLEWGLGVVEYLITYSEKTTVLPITFENQAISVSEFVSKTEGTYDVTGIVVGPNSSYAAIELLLKDVNTMDIVGIYNTGVAGAWNAPSLDTDVLNIGDQVIVELTRVIRTTQDVNEGKAYANAVNSATFLENLIIESSNNVIEYDFSLASVKEITTQQDLVDFLESSERFYGYVKFVGLKAVTTSNGSLRIFLGDDVVDAAGQKVTGSRPLIAKVNSDIYLENGLGEYFTGYDTATAGDYDNPLTTTYDVYALYVGGNKYQLVFSVLDAGFFVSAE